MKAFLMRAAAVGALAVCMSTGLGAEDLRDKKESWSGIRELEVDLSSVGIEARVGGDKLTVERVGVPSRIRISLERSGDRLTIKQEEPRFTLFPSFDINPGKLLISMPQGMLVSLESSSGDIELEGLESGRIELASSSGSISASDCEGPLAARTSSGDIGLTDCEGERSVSANSGSVRISGGEGRVEASTTSGDISLRGVSGDAVLNANSGSVSLEKTRGSLEVRTSSGGISGEDVALERTGAFMTSSGDIEIAFLNEAKELRFDLKGSSGSLEVNGNRGEHRLASGAGALLISGMSSSGSQTYKTR